MATSSPSATSLADTWRAHCGAGPNGYDVLVGHDLLGVIGADLRAMLPKVARFVVISDTNVAPLYAERLMAGFADADGGGGGGTAAAPLLKVVPAGEASKCRSVKAGIEDWMLEQRCHRDTCVVALGGGVVGDLAGFVAATYMRGVPVVQVPTSMLACVDSSIGGKTGIDSPAGKNLIGAFHQPRRVYIDLSTLATLPQRELVNGMAEVIKAGAIYDEALFALLERSVRGVLALERGVMQAIVCAAVRIKTEVVTIDEKEGGLRAILNFGHSVGHAVEHEMQPELLHGECVSIGMLKEAELARRLGACGQPTVGRLTRCCRAYGLPSRIPGRCADVALLLRNMEVDKKNVGGAKHVVLLARIGACVADPGYTTACSDATIGAVLSSALRVAPGVARGEVAVPGSKSISNRVLLMAAMGAGTVAVRGLLHSDDTQVMMTTLMKLGAAFAWGDDGAVVKVTGVAGDFTAVADGDELFIANAGTAARFLTTTAALVTANGPRGCVLTGNHRMNGLRPIGPLVDALRAHGCAVEYVDKEGFLPLRIGGTGLAAGPIELESTISSQCV